jgi:hypothetical protein
MEGHVEVVKLLLADPRVDPSANDDEAFNDACMDGHVEIVTLLLADTRVNPSANDDEAVQSACRDGSVEVVTLLLADSRVNPSLDVMQDALKKADQRNEPGIVNLLVNSQSQLMMSMYRGQVECVIDGSLREELNRWENRSALLLLLCVKRIESNETAARVSDVLREVIDVFARFNVLMCASDDSYESDDALNYESDDALNYL